MTAQLEHAMPDTDELASAYDQGYATGWVDRGKQQSAENGYVSVPLAWRLVMVGDTVVQPAREVDGVIVEPAKLWNVRTINHQNAYRRVSVEAQWGDKTLTAGVKQGDPGLDRDAQAFVLVEARDAISLAVLREQGAVAQILARTEETT